MRFAPVIADLRRVYCEDQDVLFLLDAYERGEPVRKQLADLALADRREARRLQMATRYRLRQWAGR